MDFAGATRTRTLHGLDGRMARRARRGLEWYREPGYEAPSPLPVMIVGLGNAGQAVARQAAGSRGLQIVAALDSNPAWKGMALGELLGDVEGLDGVRIGAHRVGDDPLGELIDDVPPGTLAFHTHGLKLTREVVAQLDDLGLKGINVVSTNPGLSYPFFSHPDIAMQLDEMAQSTGVVMMGLGVSPGFEVEALLSGLSWSVPAGTRVDILREAGAADRSADVQDRIGAGRSPEEFGAGVDAGWMRHPGLLESAVSIAALLGWEVHELREEIHPVASPDRIDTGHVQVEPGGIAGLRQVVSAFAGGDDAPVVVVDVTESVGLKDVTDTVTFGGRRLVATGLDVDGGTAQRAINIGLAAVLASPGLRVLSEVPREWG